MKFETLFVLFFFASFGLPKKFFSKMFDLEKTALKEFEEKLEERLSKMEGNYDMK